MEKTLREAIEITSLSRDDREKALEKLGWNEVSGFFNYSKKDILYEYILDYWHGTIEIIDWYFHTEKGERWYEIVFKGDPKESQKAIDSYKRPWSPQFKSGRGGRVYSGKCQYSLRSPVSYEFLKWAWYEELWGLDRHKKRFVFVQDLLNTDLKKRFGHRQCFDTLEYIIVKCGVFLTPEEEKILKEKKGERR